MKRINYTIENSSHVLPWLSCQDLAMNLTSVSCIMISHDLDKGTMVNHDLARLTMTLASVACLRSLGFVQTRIFHVLRNTRICSLSFHSVVILNTVYANKMRFRGC